MISTSKSSLVYDADILLDFPYGIHVIPEIAFTDFNSRATRS